MNDLELCKKFAELEGVNIEVVLGSLFIVECRNVKYNPITDLALNCAARDKYEVEVDYVDSCVYIRTNEFPYDSWIKFNTKEEIPRAVLLCILKSEGKL